MTLDTLVPKPARDCPTNAGQDIILGILYCEDRGEMPTGLV